VHRIARVLLVVVALVGPGYLAAVWLGAFGVAEPVGEVGAARRPAQVVAAREAAQHDAARAIGAPVDETILFGDLHVHTTFSMDAFFKSLPILQGEGAHPPADACDFARYCSHLDFISINDHAEGLTPRQWRETVDSIRQCNAVAGDPASPDLVAFLGWEWTQMGRTPADHYGHKNVVLRGIRDDEIPARPIAAGGYAYDAMRQRGGGALTLAMTLADFRHRQRYFDFAHKRKQVAATLTCEEGVDVHDLPDDCVEIAYTPRVLFEKLDQWGLDSIVIPHGNAWGNTTPHGVSWDKQLSGGHHDPQRQTLLEVYSGHGSSEEYRPWRAVEARADGGFGCPEPSPGYLPSCWRAGEVIRERCLAEGARGAGADEADCDERAAAARASYVAAGPRGEGRFTVPGRTPDMWLDAGQCSDCFEPAFDYRPGGSSQYSLAISHFEGGDAPPARFRFGFMASSDTHFARAGTGYKEVSPLGMTDMTGAFAAEVRALADPSRGEPAPRSVAVDTKEMLILPGGDVERSASFYYTGGLVAAHARGRDRDAIWDALERREVYATSGPRILLWFDLLNAPDGSVPMGGEVRMSTMPRFRVRALGALEQRPGCPEDSLAALSPERLEQLCRGECDHPGDRRHAIERIEVVRIRPQASPGEDVAALIDDPWRTFACDADPGGCSVEFEDPDHAAAGRDAVYYVRAIQAPTLQINGDPLRCERDDAGACTRVERCRAGASDEEDDCLSPAQARAWSSPIFVDFGPRTGAPGGPSR